MPRHLLELASQLVRQCSTQQGRHFAHAGVSPRVPPVLKHCLGRHSHLWIHKCFMLTALLSTGQNPTGAVMTPERMADIYGLARKWSLIIIEDDAYYWLQYPHGPDNVPGLNLRREWLYPNLGLNKAKGERSSLGGRCSFLCGCQPAPGIMIPPG